MRNKYVIWLQRVCMLPVMRWIPVMPGDLYRLCGTVDYDEPDPDRRAVIDVNASREDRLVEVRYFDKKQFHLPIMQAEMDANPQLVQNDGY